MVAKPKRKEASLLRKINILLKNIINIKTKVQIVHNTKIKTKKQKMICSNL